MLEKNGYVSVSKGVHKQKLQLAKVFATCKNFILLQRKTPKCKYWVLKVLCLETEMVCSGWHKNDSLCLPMKHSSKCCAACRSNGERFDIQRPNQINFTLLKVFQLKFICHGFYITIIQKSIFLTATSLVHLMWKCS